MLENPFVLRSYEAEEYFCDREKETQDLISEINNGNDITLVAPRRIGKTGLIEHLFANEGVSQKYNTFLIDIYTTKSFEEMVSTMGKSILYTLMPKGQKAAQFFFDCLKSLKSFISFDINGIPTWSVGLGDIQHPDVTLDEIFLYLETAKRPSIVAIDEFQTISEYADKKVEAKLRTHIQHCHNARFIFSGSHRTMMSEMFMSRARPFYQSTAIKSLDLLPVATYADFACRLFERYGKKAQREMVEEVYAKFDGITWYMQRMLNKIFAITPQGECAGKETIDKALNAIISESKTTFEALLFQLPPKQKELLRAINNEGKAKGILSTAFVSKYHLGSTSSVQAAVKGLIDKDFVTFENGCYEVYDKFFGLWLKERL